MVQGPPPPPPPAAPVYPSVPPPASDAAIQWRSSIARSGILFLPPGLAGMAVGAWVCWAAANTDYELGRSIGFIVAAGLILVSAPPVGMGLWLLWRPGPRAAVIGALLSGTYGLLFVLLITVNFESLADSVNLATAIALVIATLFLLAAGRLVAALRGAADARGVARGWSSDSSSSWPG